MKLPNLIGTTSFKLSALYLGLFLCSFAAIGISVYFLTVHSLEQQLKNGIETEAARLQGEYDADGMAELKNEIAENGRGSSYAYGLINQHGQLLAGNLTHFNPSAGWQTLPRSQVLQNTAGDDKFYIYVIPLPENAWLAVSHTGETIQKTGAAIIEAFLSGIALVIMLGVAGGFYLSRAFLKKINAITNATETIIAGDLQHRLPVAKNHDELDKLALLVNRMLDKIGALIENVQQVSNDIAHDLRTPISRLQFRLEDALNKPLSPTQYQEQIALAITEVDGILATFSALLRIAQIESGSRRSGFKQVNLSEIATAVTEALSPVAEEQSKTIRMIISPDINLTGDKELLTQLVFNLLENAIGHTPKQTQIELNLHVTSKRIELVIADNGPGIAEVYRQKVLQRFYRLEQSRSTAGNGLGLNIAAAIVDLHDGTLALSDNQPGLKLVVSFPSNAFPKPMPK
ncbi:MAG: HAMP domain-containing sensor histidine kinase [Methylovulum sp.]|nr:HAMP domain-containing sensor histidine kinase [Methylovulum sp.]